MWRERLELLRYEKTIPMFGPDHLTYLAIILIVGAAFLIYAKKKFNTEQADKVGRILGIVAIVHFPGNSDHETDPGAFTCFQLAFAPL